MFWDNVAGAYDIFVNVINRKTHQELRKIVTDLIDTEDTVLECACGTGAITKYVAPRCKLLVATDMSKGMLVEAQKNCDNLNNIRFRYADIMNINCRDERFDKVIAGNVIHLLDEPEKAIAELLRVCRTGGKVIIPTYINSENTSASIAGGQMRVSFFLAPVSSAVKACAMSFSLTCGLFAVLSPYHLSYARSSFL